MELSLVTRSIYTAQRCSMKKCTCSTSGRNQVLTNCGWNALAKTRLPQVITAGWNPSDCESGARGSLKWATIVTRIGKKIQRCISEMAESTRHTPKELSDFEEFFWCSPQPRLTNQSRPSVLCALCGKTLPGGNPAVTRLRS